MFTAVVLYIGEVVSFRIDEKLKRKMERLKHINWSGITMKTTWGTIERPGEKVTKKDVQKIKEALMRNIKLERKVEGWDSVEEIRKWRDEGG